MTDFTTRAMVEAAWSAATCRHPALPPEKVATINRSDLHYALEAAMKAAWRPASEKPESIEWGLVWDFEAPIVCRFDGECWVTDEGLRFKPENPWMPLPPAPEVKP